MRRFGLIGRPLGHSASAAYFTDKFMSEGITDCEYSLYELPSIEALPALLERLSKDYEVHAVDLNPDNIGQVRFGVLIEDGGDLSITERLCRQADLILCTGSTICNGSILHFLPYKEKTLFYGTTLAGAAALMELPRLCFAGNYQ